MSNRTFNFHEEEEQHPKKSKKIRLTTGRMVAIMIMIVSIVGIWGIMDAREGSHEEVKSTTNNTYEYIYTNNTYIEEFQNHVLIYDGYHLKLINESGYEEANLSLVAENFSVDAYGDKIFLVNIAKRISYVIDVEGKIAHQGDIRYLPKRVIALENGGYAVHFITDTLVEGVAIYNDKCELLSEATYPQTTITLVKSSFNNGVMVVGLYKGSSKLSNIIYEYNSKGDLERTNQIDEILVVNVFKQGSNYVWQDVNQIYVTDNEFNMIAKIESNNPYTDVEVTEDRIYTIDDDNGIKVIDQKYELIKDSRFTEDIIGLVVYKNEPLYYTSGRTIYKNNTKEYTKSLIKVVSTKNVLVIISRGEIRFERK